MTRPWSFGFTEKNLPQRSKVVKQVRCFLGGKRVLYVWIDTWANSERVSPWGSLNHLLGEFSWVSFGQSSWFAWFRVCIWYIPGSSCVSACVSQPWWILAKKPVGKLSITLVWTSKEPARWEGLLDFENENMWSLTFYLSRAQPPLLIVLPWILEYLSKWNLFKLLSSVLGAGIYLLPQCNFHSAHILHKWSLDGNKIKVTLYNLTWRQVIPKGNQHKNKNLTQAQSSVPTMENAGKLVQERATHLEFTQLRSMTI